MIAGNPTKGLSIEQPQFRNFRFYQSTAVADLQIYSPWGADWGSTAEIEFRLLLQLIENHGPRLANLPLFQRQPPQDHPLYKSREASPGQPIERVLRCGNWLRMVSTNSGAAKSAVLPPLPSGKTGLRRCGFGLIAGPRGAN